MKTVRDLAGNKNLAKLIQAQRSLEKACDIFDAVFQEEGAPADVEPVQEAFFKAMSLCEKNLERLIGTVVYHNLFVPGYGEEIEN